MLKNIISNIEEYVLRKLKGGISITCDIRDIENLIKRIVWTLKK